MDKIIERELDASLAEKLKGKDPFERIVADPLEWNNPEEPEIQDPGFFLYGTSIDFESGTLLAEWLPTESEILEIFFPTSEFVSWYATQAEYTACLEGMMFLKAKIEMLLPSQTLGENVGVSKSPPNPRRNLGRPRKWDWESAMAYIASQAQTTDGLPTGHGAQAQIETMMADWFEREVGKSPAISQIRQRASTIMKMLDDD